MALMRIEVPVSEDLREAVQKKADELGISMEAFVAAYLQGVLYTPATKSTPKATA